MSGACGTLYYVAPEVLRGTYDEKCDMWSLGVMTYIMLDGRAPFRGKDDRETIHRIRRAAFAFPESRWAHISCSARDFIVALLDSDTTQRLDAEAALAHPWLAIADDLTAETVPLDPDVLRGMRAFMRSNALKRAVLSAVAPIATVEEVSRWADQFEALDSSGLGIIRVQDLAKQLVGRSLSEAEADALARPLASDDDGESISYSSFLAACVAAHMTLDEMQVGELFQRLDKDADGLVSADEVKTAFGDVVDGDELEAELGERCFSYEDFKRLLLFPGFSLAHTASLRQLLGGIRSLQQQWRVDTRRAKSEPGADKDEAARAENRAWRTMAMRREDVRADVVAPLDRSRKPQTSIAPSLTAPRSPAADILESIGRDTHAAWAVATAEAKSGDFEAVRRENMAWRLLHKNGGRQPSA